MANFSELETKVAEYHHKFRNKDLDGFTDGGFFDLFPNSATKAPVACKYNWLDPFPYERTAGVYSILSVDLEILYIGETDNFSSRMSDYFKGSVKSGCAFSDEWKVNPRLIHFYVAPDSSKFETPALEAFLLLEISTGENKKIKYR